MTVLAIALDDDGTIAEHGVTSASTVQAQRRFKALGRRLILLTGRHLGDLKAVCPHLSLFDLVVAENGGLLTSREMTPYASRPRPLQMILSLDCRPVA